MYMFMYIINYMYKTYLALSFISLDLHKDGQHFDICDATWKNQALLAI